MLYYAICYIVLQCTEPTKGGNGHSTVKRRKLETKRFFCEESSIAQQWSVKAVEDGKCQDKVD